MRPGTSEVAIGPSLIAIGPPLTATGNSTNLARDFTNRTWAVSNCNEKLHKSRVGRLKSRLGTSLVVSALTLAATAPPLTTFVTFLIAIGACAN